MTRINIDDVTREAVKAALAVIDEATDGASKVSACPCGDPLAFKLHKLIEAAITEHMAHPDYGPAFVLIRE